MTASPKAAARAPSTTRWSNVIAMVPDRSHDDRVVADDRTRRDAPDAQDRHLRVVDDRGLEEAGELACARDGERRIAQLVRGQRAVSRPVGEACDLRDQLVDGLRIRAAHDGDDEPVVGLHRDPMS